MNIYKFFSYSFLDSIVQEYKNNITKLVDSTLKSNHRFILAVTTFALQFFSTSHSMAQSYSETCSFDGTIIHSQAISYKGSCSNNMANGWGEISWNGGVITECLLKDNKPQNTLLICRFQNGDIRFGPNIGFLNHGPCVTIRNESFPEESNISNGQWFGNSFTYGGFEIKEVNPISKKLLSVEHSKSWYSEHIPGTNYLILLGNKGGTDGSRPSIEIFDFVQNKIVKVITHNYNPIEYVQFDLHSFDDSSNPIFLLKGKTIKKYIRLNISNLTTEYFNEVSELHDLKNTADKSSRNALIMKNEYKYKSQHYKNSKLTLSYSNINGRALITLFKEADTISSAELKNRFVWDAVLDERNYTVSFATSSAEIDGQNNSIPLTDSLTLSNLYFDGKIEVFYKKKVNPQVNLTYSPSGLYLVVRDPKGNALLFSGTQLYYGIPNLNFISKNDNLAISLFHTKIAVYNLEKRLLMAASNFSGTEYTSLFHNGNSMYFKYYDSALKGHYLIEFNLPNPEFQFSEYILKKDGKIDNLSENSISSNVKEIESVQSTSINPYEQMIRAYYTYSLLIGKKPFREKCRWCNKEFVSGVYDGGYVYRKESYGECTVREAATGKYCSKRCAYEGCRAND